MFICMKQDSNVYLITSSDCSVCNREGGCKVFNDLSVVLFTIRMEQLFKILFWK